MLTSCCECVAAPNRCLTDRCPCYTTGRTCLSACETSRLAADCLNRAVCRCSCLPSTKTEHKADKNATAPCQNATTCECRRFGESCSSQCSCQRQCNLNGPLPLAPKTQPPDPACRCSSSSKKGCVKTKCTCRQSLQHCSSDCKCRMECCNSRRRSGAHIKCVRQCFLEPDQENGAIVMLLVGGDKYNYCTEFINSEKNLVHASELLCKTLLAATKQFKISQLEHIFIYMSKSPCFHQDCEPKCEVLQRCDSQRACSKLIAVTYGQLRRQLNTVNLQMTVKFLSPYVKRGDLYTQQGILHMMQAGICVQPLVLKEWNQLMLEFMTADPKTPSDNPLTLWADYTMDRSVRQSQQYINACRRTLGLKDMYWTSSFHDTLKSVTLTCDLTHKRLDEVAIKLAQMEHIEQSKQMSRSAHEQLQQSQLWGTASEDWISQPVVGVLDDELYLANASETPKSIKGNAYTKAFAKHRASSYKERSRRSPTPVRSRSMYSYANDMGEDTEADDTTDTKSEDIWNPRAHDSSDAGQLSRNQSEATLEQMPEQRHSQPQTRDVTQIILNFSGRSISEQERREMASQLSGAVDRLRTQLDTLMQYLEQKSSATPV